jgi:hypothetical protein
MSLTSYRAAPPRVIDKYGKFGTFSGHPTQCAKLCVSSISPNLLPTQRITGKNSGARHRSPSLTDVKIGFAHHGKKQVIAGHLKVRNCTCGGLDPAQEKGIEKILRMRREIGACLESCNTVDIDRLSFFDYDTNNRMIKDVSRVKFSVQRLLRRSASERRAGVQNPKLSGISAYGTEGAG